MKYILTIISLIWLPSYGQNLTFKEIKLAPNSRYYETKEKTIIYPIIVTNNKKVDNLINSQIKDEVFGIEYGKQSINNTLTGYINEYGLINLSYDITYKRNGLLSLNIFSEGCGAYCSSTTAYFNFDLKTGKEITLADLLMENKFDSFYRIVLDQKVKELNKYKTEELVNLITSNDIDSSTHNWVIEQIDSNCMAIVQLDNFYLSDSGLEVKDICEFPHAIRALQPDYKLSYSYTFLSSFFRPRFKKIFIR